MADRPLSDPAAAPPSVIGWTLTFIRPYSGRIAVLGVLSLLEVALATLHPWSMKFIADNVLQNQPFPPAIERIANFVAGDSRVMLLVVIALGGLLLQIANQVVSLFHTQVQVETGQRMVFSLRAKLFNHLQGLALRHHVNTNTGDSVYRLESDAYSIDSLVMQGLFPLTSAALTLVVMFIILLYLDVSIALLSLAVVPFLYLCIRYYMTSMLDRAEHVKELESRVIERLYETFATIKLVKSFAREAHEFDRFSDVGLDAMRGRVRLTWQQSLFAVVVGTITTTGTALVLIVGGMRVLSGDLTFGSLLVVISYLGAVYGPLSTIAHTTGNFQTALAGVRRVRRMFALEPETVDAPGAIEAKKVRGEIRFDDVVFEYQPGVQVLKGISFVANPGEMVALVGLSGAGKTTLVSLIPRFFDATSGHVLVDGRDVHKYKIRSLREQIALVLQDPVLFGGTIADNLRYGRLNATDEEIEAAARAAHAHDFILRLPKGYQSSIAEAGGGLSGGERQRLSIARALVKDAPILILDEPTSSLDALSEEAVFDALKRLCAGRTTLVIAHRLSTIRDANRIVLLDAGSIIAQGTHNELLASNDLYRRMCARLSVGRSLDDVDSIDDDLVQAVP